MISKEYDKRKRDRMSATWVIHKARHGHLTHLTQGQHGSVQTSVLA